MVSPGLMLREPVTEWVSDFINSSNFFKHKQERNCFNLELDYMANLSRFVIIRKYHEVFICIELSDSIMKGLNKCNQGSLKMCSKYTEYQWITTIKVPIWNGSIVILSTLLTNKLNL